MLREELFVHTKESKNNYYSVQTGAEIVMKP